MKITRQMGKVSQNKTCNRVFDGQRDDGRGSPSALPWPIEMLPLRRLRPAARNARTHSKKQIRQIADSIERFGVPSTPLQT